jgi:membrane dipeptidase
MALRRVDDRARLGAWRIHALVDGCRLARVVDHVDHICQLAGSASCVAIGSDLDGGFGTEQCPEDIDTIADLTRFGPLLSERGYSDTDIDGILWRNAVEFLYRSWS